MYNKYLFFVVFLLLASTFTTCKSSDDADIPQSVVAKNVLYIGNSQTFYNNGVDYYLQGFVNQLPNTETIHIDKVAFPAYTLEEHWNDIRTKNKIDSKQWNLIILQENGFVAAYNYDLMAEYAKKFYDYISAQGTSVRFFMTWSEDNDFEVTRLLEDNYNAVAEANSSQVIPGGLAFEAFYKVNTEIDLYDPDRNHPSKEGTFLIAALSYKMIYGKDPTDNAYIGNLTLNDANYIKEFISTYK